MGKNKSISSSVKKQFDLTGKCAVITGGAGFLGLQFSETIAEMGGKPILLDFDSELLQSATNNLNKCGYKNHSQHKIDITDEDKFQELINNIWEINKGIDILINSAGLTKSAIESKNHDFFADFENTNQVLWDQGLKLNLTSTQISCKIIGSKMAANGSGTIINVASDVGTISPNQNIYKPDDYGYKGVDFNTPAFYAVSKAGVIHLTKFLATYWGKDNVRVNCISPAGVYKDHNLDFVKKLSEQIPLGRMALPNEFKGAIAFLCSDASSFVTGHNLLIDGGRTIW